MRLVNLTFNALAVILVATACASQPVPTPVDVVGTAAAQLAAVMLTQTAGAFTLTPLPPTSTTTPSFTETPLPSPTSSEPPKPPRANQFTTCWRGPGPEYQHVTNITEKRKVDIIGIGSVDGWYVIRDPYFYNICWIQMAHVNVDPNMDLSWLPVMTPQP